MVVNILKVRNLMLIGNDVVVEEVQPKFFNEIIKWRNNPILNKYLNQPYKLTVKLQNKWYTSYLNDLTQGMFVVIDKKSGKPFATIGYTDYDPSKKVCVVGRLLVGESEYKGSNEWNEAILLFNNYIYNHLNVDNVFAHIVDENVASIKWHKKWGYVENVESVLFPHELEVNGMRQKEYCRSKAMYYKLLNKEV